MASDSLIPIRLDLTIDHHRIQETFTWNATETHITPQTFANVLSSDLHLPDSARSQIAASITEQISSFVPPHQPQRECRHVLRLDLRIGRVVIRDQFEWDLSAQNSPEAFAEALCADLGLATQHVPAVAHAVREQLVELTELSDKRAACPVLTDRDVIRKKFETWEPAVECLTVEETEKLERKEKRDARLQRRNRGKAEVYRKPGRRRSVASSRHR